MKNYQKTIAQKSGIIRNFGISVILDSSLDFDVILGCMHSQSMTHNHYQFTTYSNFDK